MELLQRVGAALRFPGPADDPVSFKEDPVVTITRHSDGSAIADAAATTKVEAEGEEDYFTFDVAGADLAEVDLLVAVWSDGDSSYTTYAEVVGGFAISNKAILKEYDDKDCTVDDAAEAREIATTQIEAACGVAFRPRYAKEILDGSGSATLFLAHPRLLRFLAVSVDGEELDPGDVQVDPTGLAILSSGWPVGHSNVEIAYVHGYEGGQPAGQPVLDYATYLLTAAPTDKHQRATSFSSPDGGTYSLVTPGMRGAAFPLPSVNAFVEANQYPTVG